MPVTYTTATPAAADFCLPPGDYRLRVINAAEETSKAGNPMIKLRFRVLKENGMEGPAVFDYLVFHETCYWRVDHFLQSCGRHPGPGAQLTLHPEQMLGWECQAALKVETFEGVKSNKIAAYLFEEF